MGVVTKILILFLNFGRITIFLFIIWNIVNCSFPVDDLYHVKDTVPCYNQSCPTLCKPMDCSPPGSSVRGILQAKIPEWVAISPSRGSSWSKNRTHVSCIRRWILYLWTTWKSLMWRLLQFLICWVFFIMCRMNFVKFFFLPSIVMTMFFQL